MTTYTKTCTRCQHLKEESEFSPLKHAKDGRQSSCKSCMRILVHNHRKANLDLSNARARSHYHNNREKCLKSVRNWQQQNKERVTLNARIASNKHRAAKLRAAPKWLTEKQLNQIRVIYEEASRLNLDVDHTVPLQGKTVCGLHVPWILEMISKPENCAKGNRFNDWG